MIEGRLTELMNRDPFIMVAATSLDDDDGARDRRVFLGNPSKCHWPPHCARPEH